MEQITNILGMVVAALQWLINNAPVIVEWALKIIGIATALIALIPTLSKDNWLLPIVKFIAKYIALNKSSVDDEDRP